VLSCGLGVAGTRLEFTAETQRAQRKPYYINELSKRILGTAIEVLIVRRGATVIIPFFNLCVLCVFAVRNTFLI
jgi:hypothetical protein